MDGRSNYFDDEHLTTRASAGLAPAFVDVLEDLRSDSSGNVVSDGGPDGNDSGRAG